LLDGSCQPLLKMCDFGLSKHMELNGLAKTKLGTPAYIGGDLQDQGKAHQLKSTLMSRSRLAPIPESGY
jgi:serine/threonine protein kinase